MKSRKSRQELHDLIFKQISDGKWFFSHNAFEAFMGYAATQGFTDDQVLRMAKSGMSSAQILAAVEAGASAGQRRN